MSQIKLNAAQETFVLGVFRGMTQADAFIAAYPKAAKWKRDSVHRRAIDLIKRPLLKKRLEELRDKAAEGTVVNERRTLEETARIAFSDPGALFDETGKLRPIHELAADVRAAIASIEVERRTEGRGEDAEVYYVHKIKLWDKNAAIEKLMKHLGMFKKDNEVEVTLTRRLVIQNA